MTRVLIITTEPLPLPGWPTTGAGLRAWALAKALETRGHTVHLLIPDDALASYNQPPGIAPPTDLPENVSTFTRNNMHGHPAIQTADVIVLQHWGIARELEDVSVPLAIDLAGPHLLERKLWGSPHPEKDLAEKLTALRRADFLTASGDWQRLYFLPFLDQSGWNISDPHTLPVIPYSLKAAETPPPIRNDRFIYGGFFLPWQDPTLALETLLEVMDETDKGELVFIGGEHPHNDVSCGKFMSIAARLKDHPRVQSHGPMPYDAYLDLLKEGGIALDLMQRNAERELAFTTRTVQYLACGLPVIHDNYSELGQIIERADAGWALDPKDNQSLADLFRSILSGNSDIKQKSKAALNLVSDELDWDKSIEPLADFCANPYIREGKTLATTALEQRESTIANLETNIAALQRELDTLKGKRWIRWGLHARSAGIMALPTALVLAFAGLVLFPVFWINDRLRPNRVK